jgi:hypothetical protein
MQRLHTRSAIAAMAGAAAVVAYSLSARSADHQDSPSTLAAPTADINDVFAFMDRNNVVLAMTVYPNAPAGALFDDHVQYVFHTASAPKFAPALPTTNPVDIIATFDAASPQNISLWVGTSEYVTGNATAPTGLTSADGKVTVFAGLRADPFFFNLDGFKHTAATVEAASSSLTFNDAGCPAINSTTSAVLVAELGSAPDGGPAQNHFATFNGLAIVVSLDKSLVTAGGPDVTIWAGTYATGPIGDAGGQ